MREIKVTSACPDYLWITSYNRNYPASFVLDPSREFTKQRKVLTDSF